jgi:hypothetical protein|eukprot:SAG25_NODE_795_length_5281_cov_2.756465_3_plen_77_part_00
MIDPVPSLREAGLLLRRRADGHSAVGESGLEFRACDVSDGPAVARCLGEAFGGGARPDLVTGLHCCVSVASAPPPN